MPRPQKTRQIGQAASATYFKPRGIPMRELEEVALAADELEALRLTDLDGMYQEQAAEQMGVSRQTLGLILKRAHKKVAEALVLGKAICVESAETISNEDSAPPAPTHQRGGRCGRGRHRHGGE